LTNYNFYEINLIFYPSLQILGKTEELSIALFENQWSSATLLRVKLIMKRDWDSSILVLAKLWLWILSENFDCCL